MGWGNITYYYYYSRNYLCVPVFNSMGLCVSQSEDSTCQKWCAVYPPLPRPLPPMIYAHQLVLNVLNTDVLFSTPSHADGMERKKIHKLASKQRTKPTRRIQSECHWRHTEFWSFFLHLSLRFSFRLFGLHAH